MLRPPVLRLLMVSFLFIIAFGLRLYNINEPPLDFHPTRQYRSALIARGYYFETLEKAPEWKKNLASLNKQGEGILEPPIMELMTSFAYRTLGGEHLWVARLLSTLFWLIGGVFLYLIAERIFSAWAAVFSAAFYLFLPYGIMASRSFQPEPLLIMMLLVSIFTILWYYDRPSGTRLGIAASTSSLAIFIKPVCLFLILGAFFSVAIYRQGVRRTLTSRSSLLFVGALFCPTIIFYGYGILVAGFLQDQAESSFLPHLLVQPAFWEGWLRMIVKVVGGTYLIGALLGVLMLRGGVPKAVLIGLWTSYFVFGLVFTYHIHTHDYYQLQFIPIVALSLGPISAEVTRYLSRIATGLYGRAGVPIILLLAVILSLLLVATNERQALQETGVSAFGSRVEMYQEIGEVVDHSPNSLFWAPDYGKPLKYHGWLHGEAWPRSGDVRFEELMKAPQVGTQERFKTLDAETSPEYFIVLPDDEWLNEQKDLRDLLTKEFPILAENDDYTVFDLREKD